MTLDPDLQNRIRTASENVAKVSKTILARKDLHAAQPGMDVVAAATVLEKKLGDVLVVKDVTSPMAAEIEKAILAIAPGLEQLHISESKMSALSGQLNTAKKVSSDVSSAFAVQLKETLNNLNAVEALLAAQARARADSQSTSDRKSDTGPDTGHDPASTRPDTPESRSKPANKTPVKPDPSKTGAGDYQKAIAAELGALKPSGTKINLKQLTRAD